MPAGFDELLQENKHVLLSQFVTQNTFSVPPNQRPYSWGVDNWADLWQDVLDTIEEMQDQTADPFYAHHFFGPMFFMRERGSDNLRILDGQQRLATIEIFLAVIRDVMRYFQFSGHMSQVGVDLPGKVNLYAQATGIAPARPRLILGKGNRAFFEKVLNPIQFGVGVRPSPFMKSNALRDESKESSSNESLLKCYRFFMISIAKTLSAQYGEVWPRGRPDLDRVTAVLLRNTSNCEEFLNQSFDALTERFYVLKAVVPSPEIMYQMFETLNQRGEKLVVADLFRNLLFERFERRLGEDKIESLWVELQSGVTDDFMGDFLRHYWLSSYRFVRTNNLFREIRQEIDRIDNNSEFENFMRKMITEGAVYKALRTPDDQRWSTRGISQLIDEIKYLNFKQGFPLLLAAYVKHYERETQKFHELLRVYLNLVVRSYTILRENPNEFEKDYSKWAVAMRLGTTSIDQIIATIIEETPADDEVSEEMVEMNGVSPEVGHYILTKINDAQQNSLSRAWRNNPTVEHVIPQNPENWWEEFLRSKGLKAKSLVDRLGNLTILSAQDNEELGNLPYPQKRERYLATRLPINVATFTASEFNEFTADAIKKREEVMASLVIELQLWK